VGEKGEGDHHQHSMVMNADPGARLEVVKPEFLFHLLVSLLTGPSGFHRGDDGSDGG
jgi:hypothetical protein